MNPTDDQTEQALKKIDDIKKGLELLKSILGEAYVSAVKTLRIAQEELTRPLTQEDIQERDHDELTSGKI